MESDNNLLIAYINSFMKEMFYRDSKMLKDFQ